MRKILCLLLCVVLVFPIISCGKKDSTSEDQKVLCNYYWESYIDTLRFTEEGKILRNYEPEYESISRYKLSKGKITMYAEDSIEDALTFEYKLDGDKLYIGTLEYKKVAEVETT